MSEERHPELCRILSDHAKRYPLMEPCDAVKLVFQNEYGGEHLISEPNATLAWLRAERASTPDDLGAPPVEDIGNGMVRVYLSELEFTEAALRTLNRDFCRSAELHQGWRKDFLSKLEALRSLTGRGVFAFNEQELEDCLERYVRTGCYPLSHSPAYRTAYRPAYRVVKAAASEVVLFRDLEALRDGDAPSIVAIEGRCASGKTTLAARIGSWLGVQVVHMDHFFLRPAQRTEERFAKPGGNIDHERFRAEVLEPLSEGRTAFYRPYCCQTGVLEDPIEVKPAPLVVVEGSYSCHPELWDFYRRRVFVTVEPEEQLRRINGRNGPEMLKAFRERWIPMEECYFSAYQVEDRCDYQLEL